MPHDIDAGWPMLPSPTGVISSAETDLPSGQASETAAAMPNTTADLEQPCEGPASSLLTSPH